MTTSSDRRVLIVVTGHDTLGHTGDKTGFHYEELTTPYYALRDAGYTVDIASPEGGAVAHDPGSLPEDESKRAESVRRFLKDADAVKQIHNTLPIDKVKPEDYAGLYLPGGHGTMWDFPPCKTLHHLIATYDSENKIIAAVCHGPAAFVNVKELDGQEYFVNGRTLNSFTDAEEHEVKKADIVPFLLEETLRERGADFVHGKPWEGFAVRDGNLVTGQNPMACSKLSELMIAALDERRKQHKAA